MSAHGAREQRPHNRIAAHDTSCLESKHSMSSPLSRKVCQKLCAILAYLHHSEDEVDGAAVVLRSPLPAEHELPTSRESI